MCPALENRVIKVEVADAYTSYPRPLSTTPIHDPYSSSLRPTPTDSPLSSATSPSPSLPFHLLKHPSSNALSTHTSPPPDQPLTSRYTLPSPKAASTEGED